MSLVTVDLDSTLADTTHRHHLIDRVNGTDWIKYAAACVDDAPILATVALIKLLAACGVKIVYVTGRDESSRGLTLEWFDKCDLPCDGLYMDDESGGATYRHSVYKLKRVQEVISSPEWENEKHWFHIDDWPDVKVALEDAGIPCLCVRTPEEIELFMTEQREGPK